MNAGELEALLARELPRVDHRGEHVEEIGSAYLRMRLAVRPEYVSLDMPPGSGQAMLSAPVMMGFADTAMYAAVHAFYGASAIGAIVNISTSFMSIAGSGDLLADVTLLKKGRKLAFLETRLTSLGKTEPCALVTATYSVWQP